MKISDLLRPWRRTPHPAPVATASPNWAPLVVQARELLEKDLAIYGCILGLAVDGSELRGLAGRACVHASPPVAHCDPDEVAERVMGLLVAGQANFLSLAVNAAVHIVRAHAPEVGSKLEAQPLGFAKGSAALRALRRIESEHVISPR